MFDSQTCVCVCVQSSWRVSRSSCRPRPHPDREVPPPHSRSDSPDWRRAAAAPLPALWLRCRFPYRSRCRSHTWVRLTAASEKLEAANVWIFCLKMTETINWLFNWLWQRYVCLTELCASCIIDLTVFLCQPQILQRQSATVKPSLWTPEPCRPSRSCL